MCLTMFRGISDQSSQCICFFRVLLKQKRIMKSINFCLVILRYNYVNVVVYLHVPLKVQIPWLFIAFFAFTLSCFLFLYFRMVNSFSSPWKVRRFIKVVFLLFVRGQVNKLYCLFWIWGCRLFFLWVNFERFFRT